MVVDNERGMMSMELNLPSDLFTEEQFGSLTPIEKEKYVTGVLKKILEANPNGVTISQIAKELSYFSRASVWRHLELLMATREGYRLDFGKVAIYYPNGKQIHHAFQNDVKLGDSIYGFFFVTNNFGDFLYIQEKKEDKLGMKEVCGGLVIPASDIPEFIETINKSFKEVEKYGNNNTSRGSR